MSQSRDFMLDAAMKAVLWEECKGKLRAMVALVGSYQSGYWNGQAGEPPWKRLDALTEAFISDVEDDGLNE